MVRPYRDCLAQHVQCTSYQASYQAATIVLKVGVEKDEGNADRLVVHWMTSQPAPWAILDMLAGNCTKRCTQTRCVCMVNGLKCTDMSKLKDSDNQADDDDCIKGLQGYFDPRENLVYAFVNTFICIE